VLKPIGELPPAEGALAVLETRSLVQDPGFVTPMEVQFEFGQPIPTSDALRTVVDGVQAMPGVAAVKSDGIHMVVQLDTSRVQPAQIRQLVEQQLGYQLSAGTQVPDAGTTAD
jgi:hypothetical protein